MFFDFFASSFAYFSHTPSSSSGSFGAGFLVRESTVPLMNPMMLMKNVIVAIAKATTGEMMIAIVSVKNLKKMFIKYKKCDKMSQSVAKCEKNCSKCGILTRNALKRVLIRRLLHHSHNNSLFPHSKNLFFLIFSSIISI